MAGHDLDDNIGNSLTPPEVLHGFIRSVQIEKGFGFLVGPDGVERFFHVTQLRGCRLDELQIAQGGQPGTAVRFTIEPERLGADGKSRGPRACNVHPA